MDLITILENHKIWIDSEEVEGERADLSGANLSDCDFTDVNLTRVVGFSLKN